MDDLIPFVMFRGHRIEPGHPVKVLPSPGKQDGFKTKLVSIRAKEGRVVGMDVRDPYSGGLRTVPPRRIQPFLKQIDIEKGLVVKNPHPKVMPTKRKKSSR